MKKDIPVYFTTAVKACRSSPLFNPKAVSSPLLPPLPLQRSTTTTTPRYGNPCLDLFYNVRTKNRHLSPNPDRTYSPEYLKELLPGAWSHNPLTTLKLIGNLLDGKSNGPGKHDGEGFLTAAYWLYQQHPQTLASNAASFHSLGGLTELFEILYRTLHGEEDCVKGNRRSSYGFLRVHRETRKGIGGFTSSKRRRKKIAAMAQKAAHKYYVDRNYRLLHDGISNLYAQCFKHDIQSLNKYHQNQIAEDCDGGDHDHGIEMTMTAECCGRIESTYDRATLLFQNIAKKMFQDSGPEDDRVRMQRLKNEVLVPLRKVLDLRRRSRSPDGRSYAPQHPPKLCPVKTYLQEVVLKAAGMPDKIKANAAPRAPLPHEIVEFVMCNKDNDDNKNLVAAAELQWKTTVGEMEGKFKHCIVLRSDRGYPYWDEALQLLASQLAVEPWKGKFLYVNPDSQLVIQECPQKDDDLFKSEIELASSLKYIPVLDLDIIPKVFDLILESAVKWNLKPEQMIKKVFVFPSLYCKDEIVDQDWQVEYEEVRSRFEEKGYGDVVPHIVIWRLSGSLLRCSREQPGLTVVKGFTNDLAKYLLDNDGDIGPEQIMQAALSNERYADLVVVD